MPPQSIGFVAYTAPQNATSSSGSPVPRNENVTVGKGSAVSSQVIAEELNAHSNPHVIVDLTGGFNSTLKNLGETLDSVIIDISVDEPVATAAVSETIEQILKDANSSAKKNTAPGSVAEFVALQIDKPELFENSQHSPDAPPLLQRAQTIVDSLGELLGKLGRNEFEGDLGRLASNLTISGLHTGLIVGTLTTIRQLVGFAIEKCLQTNAASPLTRNVIGGLSLMIGPALNILGALRDECTGTANANTRLARLATLTLSMAAFGVALAAPQALPALASFGPQMGFYTLARDLVHLFINTSDNAQPSAGGVAASAGLYGALQFLAGTAMDKTAPNSGAGYAMSGNSEPSTTDNSLAAQLKIWMERPADTAISSNLSPEDRAKEILESLTPVLEHDLLRGAYNAGVEVLDKVVGGEIMHAFQSEKAPEGYRVKFTSPQVPTLSQVSDKLLTTAAMRTSFGQTIMAAAISAGTYFDSLGLPASVVNHAVNAVVAAVAIAGIPGFVYAHTGNQPVETKTV
ncbi:TPA: hypothetical protein SAN82_000412 [Pseudomonas putida]|nr:hypothetical protein [Pseudomonas putida]